MKLDDITERVKKISKETMAEVQKMNEVRGLNSQISAEKKKIREMYTEMGKKLYDCYKEEPLEGFESDFHSLNQAFGMIEELQGLIRAAKGVVLCPNCRMEVGVMERFCSNCGCKMPEEYRIGMEEEPAAPEAVTGEVSEEVPEAVTGKAAEEVSEAATGEAAEEVSEAVTGEAAEEVSEAAIGGAYGNGSEAMTGDAAGETSESVTGDAAEETSEVAPGEMPEEVSETVTEVVPEEESAGNDDSSEETADGTEAAVDAPKTCEMSEAGCDATETDEAADNAMEEPVSQEGI
ncbi:MAG: hypothetical protein LUG99_06060 [Lachnospiraceae bacterium]|nr:hypothetical protein [Lachnospiraceae bacterium]